MAASWNNGWWAMLNHYKETNGIVFSSNDNGTFKWNLQPPETNIQLAKNEVLQMISCFHILERYKKLKYILRLQRNFRSRYYTP
jgi:hypothetical protein